MKTRLFGFFAALVLFGASPSQAVPLVDQGSNTYDPNTGLQWLDVTLTQGLSYNNVTANYLSTGGLYQGYRYATGVEVSTLFTDAGISNPYNGVPNGEASAVQALISLLGVTLNDPGYYDQTFGITADLAPNTNHWLAMLRIGISQVATTQWIGEGPDFTEVDLGSFLVMNAASTPLPAALPLFASGLGALSLLGWRRKRKAAAVAA